MEQAAVVEDHAIPARRHRADLLEPVVRLGEVTRLDAVAGCANASRPRVPDSCTQRVDLGRRAPRPRSACWCTSRAPGRHSFTATASSRFTHPVERLVRKEVGAVPPPSSRDLLRQQLFHCSDMAAPASCRFIAVGLSRLYTCLLTCVGYSA